MNNRFPKNIGLVYKTFEIYKDPAERIEPRENAKYDVPGPSARVTEQWSAGAGEDPSTTMMYFFVSNMSDISALSKPQQRKLKEQILAIIENLLETKPQGNQ